MREGKLIALYTKKELTSEGNSASGRLKRGNKELEIMIKIKPLIKKARK